MATFWDKLPRPILALAPMEGVNDTAFRQICKLGGADLMYTEFTSADAIAHNARKSMERLQFDPREQPVIAQIFGRIPENFAIAAKKIEQLGFAGLDINFGCPARKVVNHGAGVALFRKPDFARQLIQQALDHVSIPVSIKIRTGIRKERPEVDPNCTERITALDFLEAVGDLPIAAIMVHGRSYEQGHQGDVDAAMIRQVKERFKGIVLANGGITNPERVVTMLQETSADGVGIARGAWGQPWIFKQARELLNTGAYTPTSPAQLHEFIRAHAQLLFASKGAHGLLEFRKHFANYIKSRPGARTLRAQAVQVESLAQVEAIITQLELPLTEPA
jgi:tRNA-dihydrouridine synthase B